MTELVTEQHCIIHHYPQPQCEHAMAINIIREQKQFSVEVGRRYFNSRLSLPRVASPMENNIMVAFHVLSFHGSCRFAMSDRADVHM